MTFGDQCSENLANFFSKLITLFIYLSLSRDSCYLYLSFLVLACLSIDRGKRKYRFVESTDVVEAAVANLNDGVVELSDYHLIVSGDNDRNADTVELT